MKPGLSCRLLLALALLLPAPSLLAEDLPRLYLYTENYGDFNYSLSGRNYEHWAEDIGGSATTVVKKMLAETGLDHRMRLRTWSVSYERSIERPNHGVFSTARTESREDSFYWIGPVGQYNWILLAKAGHDYDIDSLDDIRGLRIGGYEGDAASTYLQGLGFEVSTLPNESLNAQRLAQDQIDLWITSDINGYKLARETGYADVEEAFRIRAVGLYLAMNPETDPRILTALENAYDNLVEQGEVDFE